MWIEGTYTQGGGYTAHVIRRSDRPIAAMLPALEAASSSLRRFAPNCQGVVVDLTRPSGWREFRAGKNGVHWLATYEHADPTAYDAAKTAYDAAFEAAMGRRPESWEYELGRKAERLRYFRMGQPSGWPPVAADGLYYNWYDDPRGSSKITRRQRP